MCILGSVKMRASIGGFFAPVGMVAILAHALRIEDPVHVRALSDLAPGSSLLRLLGLLGLAGHSLLS